MVQNFRSIFPFYLLLLLWMIMDETLLNDKNLQESTIMTKPGPKFWRGYNELIFSTKISIYKSSDSV